MHQVMTWFPLTQVNALLKQILMKDAIIKVFDNAPTSVITNYKESYGIILQNASGEHLSSQFMLAYLSIIIVVLLGVDLMIKKIKK